MFLGNVFLVMKTWRNLHKTRQLLHFNPLLALVRVAETQRLDAARPSIAAAALHQDGGGAAPVLFSRSPPRSLRPRVQFHCAICMSGASQRGCGMTSAPADPQSCCHPSSPRSPSWMVRSPSNQGPGFAARGPEAIGKSIDTPRPSLASCLAGGWLTTPPFLTLLPLSLIMAE